MNIIKKHLSKQKRIVVLIMMLLTMVSYNSAQKTIVYVCTNNGVKYHINSRCPRLGTCVLTPKAVSLEDAISGIETKKGFISFNYCKTCSKSLRQTDSQIRANKNHRPVAENNNKSQPEVQKNPNNIERKSKKNIVGEFRR